MNFCSFKNCLLVLPTYLPVCVYIFVLAVVSIYIMYLAVLSRFVVFVVVVGGG